MRHIQIDLTTPDADKELLLAIGHLQAHLGTASIQVSEVHPSQDSRVVIYQEAPTP